MSYCPFSDHKFVVALLEFKSAKPVETSNMLRKLSAENLKNIKTLIDLTDFSDINTIYSVDDRWNLIKNRILDVVNTIAPVKKVKLKNQDENSPWIDDELKDLYKQKEYPHQLKCLSNNIEDNLKFIDLRKKCKKIRNQKMVEFFADKTAKDFKCSKKFYKFYISYIKTKQSKKSGTIPAFVSDGINSGDNPEAIAKVFNNFFTNISSVSISNISDSEKYISDKFNSLKHEGLIKTPEKLL